MRLSVLFLSNGDEFRLVFREFDLLRMSIEDVCPVCFDACEALRLSLDESTDDLLLRLVFESSDELRLRSLFELSELFELAEDFRLLRFDLLLDDRLLVRFDSVDDARLLRCDDSVE